MKNNCQTKKLGRLLNNIQNWLTPKVVGVFGLSLNAFGSIILAISLTAGDGRQTSVVSGIDYHLALISDIGFKIGFYFLLFGFILQITEKIHIKEQKIKLELLLTTILLSLIGYIYCINIITRILFI